MKRIAGKRKVIFTLCYAFFLVVVMRSCSSLEKSTAEKRLYEGLSRNEILAKCTSCHAGVHENEKMGPHAHAYLALLNHRKEVNDPAYTEKPYSHFVNRSFDNMCVTCHASKNLFEENFRGLETVADLSMISNQSHPAVFSSPPAREDSTTWISGIDCITCHYTGKNVAATAAFTENPQNRKLKDYCFPVASRFLSSDMFCATCHADPYKDMQKYILLRFVSDKVTCNGCHQEYKDGKGTHYFYWRHDAESKKSDAYNNLLFAGFDAQLAGNNIQVKWVNTGIPHEIGKCRDYVTTVEVKDAAEKIIATHLIRLNRKDDHAADMAQHFENNYSLPGQPGHEFHPFTDTITAVIPLPKNFTLPLTLRVSALNKAQYWAPDSVGIPMAFKTVTLSPLLTSF